MEHNSLSDLATSDSLDWDAALRGESLLTNADDEDEFDYYGFQKDLSEYKSNPYLLVEKAGINGPAIAHFIQQANNPLAITLMTELGIFRRYDNEIQPGLWIQETAFNFTKKWIKRCDWDNCGELNAQSQMKKWYHVNYWTHKVEESLRFRKYYIPGLLFAVFIVFYESTETEPSTKKKKLDAEPNSSNYQTFGTNSSPVSSSTTSYCSPSSDGSHQVVNSVQDDFSEVHLAGQALCNPNNNLNVEPQPETSDYQNQYLVNLHYQVFENSERSKQNAIEIERLKEQQRQLSERHVALDITTALNSRSIEDLTHSVAVLEISSQDAIIRAIVSILRKNNGTYDARSIFASKVRELLQDKTITTAQVNRILSTILETRGVVQRSADKTMWILNAQAAKNFNL